MKKGKHVAVSGGFDPIHVGHLQMFRAAKLSSNKVTVILNGDSWLLRKKGYVFMPAKDRAAILKELIYVDEVYIHESEDDDVCGALAVVKPDIFLNGGDRFPDNTPEKDYCLMHGIDMQFNAGGGKVESSSSLVEDAAQKIGTHRRPWGSYRLLAEGNNWALKTIKVKPGETTSLQTHELRTETWILAEGELDAVKGEKTHHLDKQGDSITIKVGEKHRIIGGPEGAVIVEIMNGIYREDDIIRHEDKYNRV